MLHHSLTAAPLPALVALTAMWLAMMTAMMAPAAWPWVRAFHRFGVDVDGRRGRVAATLSFASGYLAAWLGYSGLAALLQFVLARGGAASTGGIPPRVAAGILLVAGLYQFAPQKRACLTHCRNPISYFLSRWRNGSGAGFRLGFGHGVFCVGCCWALMATALVVGMSNLWWMAALTAVAFIEQVIPHGDRIRIPLGITLIAAGLFQV